MNIHEAQRLYDNRPAPEPQDHLDGEDLFLWMQETLSVKRLRGRGNYSTLDDRPEEE